MNYSLLAQRMALGIADPSETRGMDPVRLRAARLALGGAVRMGTVEEARAVAPDADEDPLEREYVFSDETPDRYGDVVSVSGWELDEYRANPVILWQHDRYEPVAQTVEVRRGEHEGRPALIGRIRFAEKGTDGRAGYTRELVRQGILRAVSVGFNIVDALVPDNELAEQLGVGRYGLWITRTNLLEVSMVSIPANPSALERMVQEGALSEGAAELAKAMPTRKQLMERLSGRVLHFAGTGEVPDAGPGPAPNEGGAPDPMALAATQMEALAARFESGVQRVERAIAGLEQRKSEAPAEATVDAESVAALTERLRRRAESITTRS